MNPLTKELLAEKEEVQGEVDHIRSKMTNLVDQGMADTQEYYALDDLLNKHIEKASLIVELLDHMH